MPVTTKRENWKGRYFTVTRDPRGRFVTWRRWTWKKKIPPEEPWFTCSLKYNTDRHKIDYSCTGQGTEEEIKARVKKFMIRDGWRSSWWEGYSLILNQLELPILCERAVGEIKTEECVCSGDRGP